MEWKLWRRWSARLNEQTWTSIVTKFYKFTYVTLLCAGTWRTWQALEAKTRDAGSNKIRKKGDRWLSDQEPDCGLLWGWAVAVLLLRLFLASVHFKERRKENRLHDVSLFKMLSGSESKLHPSERGWRAVTKRLKRRAGQFLLQHTQWDMHSLSITHTLTHPHPHPSFIIDYFQYWRLFCISCLQIIWPSPSKNKELIVHSNKPARLASVQIAWYPCQPPRRARHQSRTGRWGNPSYLAAVWSVLPRCWSTAPD